MAAEILIALKTGVEFFFFDILSYLDLDLDSFFISKTTTPLRSTLLFLCVHDATNI